MYRRAAEDHEFEPLFAVHRDAFKEHVERLWGDWDDDWQRDHFRRECSESSCEAVVVDEVLAGYVQYVHQQHRLRLWNIALKPEFRGRGFGTLIIRDLQERTRAHGAEMELRVLSTNERAYRLYMRLGFREVSRDETAMELLWRPI